jgi:hypothetical protein
MPFSIAKRVKGFIINPVESFQQSRDDELGNTIKYFGVILTIFATLLNLIGGAGNEFGYFIGYVIVYIIAGFIGLFVGGVAIHFVGTVIVGRTEGPSQALKTLAYSSTPAMLFGWIPTVGVIFGIWTIIILILGIRELYKISTVNAMIALCLSGFNAITISFILLLIFALLVGDDNVLELLISFVFFLALLFLFDGGAYRYCKSRRELSSDRHFPNPALSMSPPGQQKYSRDGDLFFYQSSTVSSQMTGTPQRIETGLQRMKSAHPAWIDRPEFAPFVSNIQENLLEPSSYGDAERLYIQLESRVEQIEHSIDDLDRLIGDLDQLR